MLRSLSLVVGRLTLLAAACALLAPAAAGAQQPASGAGTAADSARLRAVADSIALVRRSLATPTGPALRPPVWRDTTTFRLGLASPLLPFGRFAPQDEPVDAVVAARATLLEQTTRARVQSLWGQTAVAGFSTASTDATAAVGAGTVLELEERDRRTRAERVAAQRRASADSAHTAGDSTSGLFSGASDLLGGYADLNLDLSARLETKVQRDKNERCNSSLLFVTGANCRSSFQPNFDFQFNVRTGGVVADRVHVNVDYDSQREFDASNNISVYYEGKPDELLQRLEVGNVSFAPPASRFITGGIPSGNYGVQAIGQLGPMRFRTIVAQQKGNVVRDRVFTVGDRTLQTVDVDLEDYKVEARRFFFTVDPRQFKGYPNIDVLNAQQMSAAAGQLPDSVRPAKIYLYRLRFGEQPLNPNGPQFIVRGSRTGQNRGPVYELLREGVDYYLDPSQLWFALVRPLSFNSERLVVAYTVRLPGRDRSEAGGTPDIAFTTEPQFANLIYDPAVVPGDSAFYREIRSVYRFGGDDIQRSSVGVKIVTGASGDQEKPIGGGFDTYLQMFSLSQANNSSTFDIENRLWPRPSDPNFSQATGATGGKLIRDNFLIFPSLRPFAGRDSGLVSPGNVRNDSIYTTPSEDLQSTRHPQSVYHIRARYQAVGGGDAGSLALGSVQVSRNSERLLVNGIQLKRDVDYTVDYELGRVTFLRPDTLFAAPRQVTVQYEENPLFAAAPTAIFGFASQFPMTNGTLNFTAISQSQRTTFTRPPLGLEPVSSLVAGVSGAFTFDADPLSRALQRLPFSTTTAPSRIDVSGEFATSRPQPNAAGQAYVESFEGEGGTTIQLADPAWYYSSQPADGKLATLVPGVVFDTAHAATLAWQNNGIIPGTNVPLTRTIDQIDPQVNITGNGVQSPEQILWLTMYPLSVGGLRTGRPDAPFNWVVPDAPRGGRRWRSIRTSLGPAGSDLSRVETLEFWTLVDTNTLHRKNNPTLVFDFGDISENSVAFSPTRLCLGCATPSGVVLDSLYTGKQAAGLDTMNTERNALSRGFDVGVDDNGLPGDVVPRIQITGPNAGSPRDSSRFATCRGANSTLQTLGDSRANCTVANSRLDEEDIDLDGQLNLRHDQRSEESILRYVVDLSADSSISRLGKCETAVQSGGTTTQLCWVYVRVPFRVPADSLNTPSRRRMRALRVTMAAGAGLSDTTFAQLPITRLKLVGSPWLKRSERAVAGVGGEAPGLGSSYVIAGIIGTQDSTSNLQYESPPGVSDQPEQRQTGLETTRTQINERSLRLQAGDLRVYDRAEAYYRFTEGQRNFMTYKALRVWAKGRGNGWGEQGQLNFYIKIGRDEDNFYMYRVPVSAGTGTASWTDVKVDFDKLFGLRAELQNAFLQGGDRYGTCSAVDRALIDRSAPPVTSADTSRRYAACADGYMAYTADPNTSAPNLAAVQELAVGMVRVAAEGGTNPILPASDSLELWVDDIRLTDVVDTPGYAGQLGVAIVAADVADFRVNVSRRDPNFRQLTEQPTFVTDGGIDLATAVHLERLLPQRLGLALPFTVNYSRANSDPYFLSRSDLLGGGIQGLRTPKRSATSFSLGLRRSVPLQNAWLGPIVNNLALSSSYATAGSRSEFQEGSSSNMNVALDYNLAAQARARRLTGLDRAIMHLPSWLKDLSAIQALRNTSLRWTPTQFRFTSAYADARDNRLSFTKPAESITDTARVVRGLTKFWRNGSTIELRPFEAIALRWDIASLHDLRDYRDRLGDTTALQLDIAQVAAAERHQLFGVDVGLERERTMNSSFSFAPRISAWVRPRFDFGTSYSMLRDPNTLQLMRENVDSTGAYRLPRRLANSQTFTTAVSVDPARGAGQTFGDSSRLTRVINAIQPVDITYNRNLLSAFDGVPFTPDLAYQFALGSVGDFRYADGRPATTAGRSSQLAVNSSILLPLGALFTGRFQRSDTRNWTRRFDNTQGVVDGANVSFPNVGLRWNARPARLKKLLSSVGLNADYVQTKASEFRPGEGESPDEESSNRVRTYRLIPSLLWAYGGLSTSGGFSLSQRVDARPGSETNGETRDYNVELGRSFALPTRLSKRHSALRTRLSWQQSHTTNYVFSSATTGAPETALNNARVRLADNGRSSVNFNGETDLAENVVASLIASHVLNFDDLNNRRFTQTVFSAVMQIQFYGGQGR